MHESRRRFLRSAATTTTVLTAASMIRPVFGSASSAVTVNLGIIGCGSIMHHHVKGLAKRDDISISWLCDVDPKQMESISKHVQGPNAQRTAAYENVIKDRNVDAVIIATPHHWHAPIAVNAMAEGKDVYIEKPISHVYQEGHVIMRAAEKYDRVVQQGSQMRSSPVTDRAGQLLKNGIIGEIKIAKAWTAEMRSVVKPVPDSTPPNGVDYDRWLGPAPKRSFNKHRFHQTWRMYRDYANGEIGDDGIHDIDMAAWGLKIDSAPTQVTARGGRMMLHGHASEYPDNMNVTWEFADGRIMVYENYPFTSYGMHGFDNGNVFYGTEGYMIFSRRGAFSVFLGPKAKPGPTEGDVRGQRGYTEHMTDFLNAVRSRNRKTRAPAETAHKSCALVHLAEIAYRCGGQIDFDPARELVIANEKANRMMTKEYRGPFDLPTV